MNFLFFPVPWEFVTVRANLFVRDPGYFFELVRKGTEKPLCPVRTVMRGMRGASLHKEMLPYHSFRGVMRARAALYGDDFGVTS